MGIEIVIMEDCASNYGIFNIPGSKGMIYEVSLHGSEGAPYCTCLAFKYSKDKTCKHIKKVYEEACLYNPQWKEGKENPAIKPLDLTYHKITGNKCPHCEGDTVYVKRAI